MKKFMVCLLVVLMCFSLAACDSGEGGKVDANKVTVGLDFDLPAGFQASADNPDMYLHETYPTESSNINFTATEKDPMFDSYSREVLSAAISSLYKEMYGLEVSVDCTDFQRTEIDGYKAIVASYEYDLSGVKIHQTQCIIAGDETYTITFTDMTSDLAWKDDFNATIDSIKVKTEAAPKK